MIVYMCEIEVYVFSAHLSSPPLSKASPNGREEEENEKLNMQKRNWIEIEKCNKRWAKTMNVHTAGKNSADVDREENDWNKRKLKTIELDDT